MPAGRSYFVLCLVSCACGQTVGRSDGRTVGRLDSQTVGRSDGLTLQLGPPRFTVQRDDSGGNAAVQAETPWCTQKRLDSRSTAAFHAATPRFCQQRRNSAGNAAIHAETGRRRPLQGAAEGQNAVFQLKKPVQPRINADSHGW